MAARHRVQEEGGELVVRPLLGVIPSDLLSSFVESFGKSGNELNRAGVRYAGVGSFGHILEHAAKNAAS